MQTGGGAAAPTDVADEVSRMLADLALGEYQERFKDDHDCPNRDPTFFI